MLTAGKIQTLHLTRFSDNGAYLMDEEMNEVLLPNRYVTEQMEEGDSIEVFIYHDSEDRLVASTEYPFAVVGDIAALEVVGTTPYGAFLDWGLPKDLFLPRANQLHKVASGDVCIVALYTDNVTGRIVATEKLNKFVSNDEITVVPGEEVKIIVARRNDNGYRVVVNGRHWGMIYFNQIFKEIEIGDTLTGFIQKITEDKRIDISLQRPGYDGVKESAGKLISLMERQGGVLALCDNSSPEEISEHTQMSKKVFKRAVGYLLKTGSIEQQDGYIALRPGYRKEKP